MQTLYSIKATGEEHGGDKEHTWTVATYSDEILAQTHLLLCQNFLTEALAKLPTTLSFMDGWWALMGKDHPWDTQFAERKLAFVTYSLETQALRSELPNVTVSQELFGPADGESTQLLLQVRRDVSSRWWANSKPIEPTDEQTDRQVWLHGCDPRLPAINGLPGETGRELYKRLVKEDFVTNAVAHAARAAELEATVERMVTKLVSQRPA